jgi:cell wall-associated NlpC family hydrolase
MLGAGFLALPSRAQPSTEFLRRDYLAGLQRYEGVTYYWGGETSRGIDCSGLIRRGLIDALLRRGVRTLDPGLVRRAISLWWHDCTASALGDQHRGLTLRVLDTPSVNALDHSKVLPGDLAVTRNGIHIMAYLGNNRWIEADPGAGRVITVTAPSADNSWFETPMNIVRWSILQ